MEEAAETEKKTGKCINKRKVNTEEINKSERNLDTKNMGKNRKIHQQRQYKH